MTVAPEGLDSLGKTDDAGAADAAADAAGEGEAVAAAVEAGKDGEAKDGASSSVASAASAAPAKPAAPSKPEVEDVSLFFCVCVIVCRCYREWSGLVAGVGGGGREWGCAPVDQWCLKAIGGGGVGQRGLRVATRTKLAALLAVLASCCPAAAAPGCAHLCVKGSFPSKRYSLRGTVHVSAVLPLLRACVIICFHLITYPPRFSDGSRSRRNSDFRAQVYPKTRTQRTDNNPCVKVQLLQQRGHITLSYAPAE